MTHFWHILYVFAMIIFEKMTQRLCLILSIGL